MQCPKCQIENRDGIKFCEQCGAKMELECPNCKAKVPLGKKFCGDCGHDLSQPFTAPPKELSFDEKIAKIQKYLPSGITEKILSQRDRIEGEKRQVTVLFCDMKGFTPLSEKLGPEAMYAMMDEVYEILIHKVHEYEGTVNEMTGDGVMALFGAPIALEDAPQRAIRSAMAIHREMTRFNERMRQEKGEFPPVKMRVGIHTGPVVVGTLGNDLRVEFKAVGDTVNLASRMESLAEPGTTYISEDTFKLTEGLFRFEGLGEKAIKGKEKPIRIYRVIAPSTSRTRFDVSAERGLTPLVGRERERELLLDAFERARQGRGQAVSIVSEAGMGKSRLLYEFRKAILNEDVTFLEGKCLSFSRSVAYQPIADILKSNFDIREGDPGLAVRNKVKQGLKALALDEGPSLPYILELLSVQDSGIEEIAISPEGKKDKITEIIKKLVLKGAEARPLVLAIEDLHWIDKTSEDVFKYLLASIAGARVLLILTYRPEFIPTWGARSYHNQLLLNRLSNRESLFMATHILDTEDLETALEEVILEKTEGIPFFVEEFIKSMKDLGVIERKDHTYHISKELQTIRIPSSIQDIIMSRVDQLPPGAKEVLKTGSVIEREFDFQLIKQAMRVPEPELLSCLSLLKDSELLYERGIFPDSHYIFKHALTREVVYDSILTDRKKMLHGRIGEAMETLYKDQLREICGLLSEHFIISGNYIKGGNYSKLAGQKAEKTGSVNDAIGYALKRLSCLENLPRSFDIEEKIIDLRIIVGIFMMEMSYFKRAQEVITPIRESALKGNAKKISQLLTIIGTLEFAVEEDFISAFHHLEEALRISQTVVDPRSLAMVSYWIGCAQAFNCEFEKARINMGRSEEIVRKAKMPWREAVLKSLLSHFVYYYQGKIAPAFKTSSEAVKIAEESGDIYSKGFAYSCHGISCFGRGSFQEALDCLHQGKDFCEKLEQYWWVSWSNHFLGEVYFDLEQYPQAIDHYTRAVFFFDRYSNWYSSIIVSKIGLIRAKIMNKENNVDLDYLYKTASKMKQKVYEGWIKRYVSEILLNRHRDFIKDAEHWIQKAIEADRNNGMNWHLAKDYLSYANLLTKKGDRLQAIENLGKAIDLMRGCGADGWVKRYEEELANLT